MCRAVLELYLVYDCGMQELTIILDRSGVRPEMQEGPAVDARAVPEIRISRTIDGCGFRSSLIDELPRRRLGF